ncbi:cuticle protein 14-like [Brevipalpus obovatus]|uniref:cuticle protein 14-like n=1 Tax=Brevipalpus obovatus TaxID=246614 RepID=UPI003D9F0676
MIKIIFFAACLFAGSYAEPLDSAYTPVLPVTLVNTGASSQYRSQDNIGNYAFGYNEDHSSGGTFRREQGDAHGTKIGSYGLRDADGRMRIVNYIADALGFRASIQTNEPGTEPRDSADVLVNKAVVAPVAAPIALASTHNHYAPAPAYSAPAYPAYATPYESALQLDPAYSAYYAHGLALPYGNFGVRRR